MLTKKKRRKQATRCNRDQLRRIACLRDRDERFMYVTEFEDSELDHPAVRMVREVWGEAF